MTFRDRTHRHGGSAPPDLPDGRSERISASRLERRRRWRGRVRTVEALASLGIAATLVALVPFRLWRGSLGTMGVSPPDPPAEDRVAYRAVPGAVARANHRTGSRFVCLTQAMAVQWMLRRRRCPSVLVMGVRAGPSGRLDDLHAWVEARDRVIVGNRGGAAYIPTLRLSQS